MNIYLEKTLATGKFLLRTGIVWIGEILVLYILANLSIGLTLSNLATAAIVIIILEIINGAFWPLIARLFLPFLVYTIGIGSLLLNAGIIWGISLFIPTVNISGYALILVPLGIAAIHTILTTILTLDDEDSYYNFIIRRKTRRAMDGSIIITDDYINNIRYNTKKNNDEKDIKINTNTKDENFGLIIIEIDGLAKDILEEAIEKGYMPTLASWKNTTHKIRQWETDLSSQTGSSQAGILHGNNENIVAFRWVEKENNNKIMVSTGLLDAPKIEKRISDGSGLLHKNGSSRSNLFSGDTNNVLFTYSKMYDIRKFYNRTWYYVYSNPANFGRILLLCGADILREAASQINHKIKNIRPRIRKNFIYYFVRACANVYIREINTQTIVGDMIKGKTDIIYSTYLGYDEIAHHSGIRDNDAFHSLKGLDRQIKRIASANKYSKKPYHIVVQSDHGQSNGATFKQRYNLSLKDLVHNLLPEHMKIYSELSSNEDHFSQAITLPIKDVKDKFKDSTNLAKGKYDEISTKIISKRDNILEYVKKYKVPKIMTKEKVKTNLNNAEVIVLASGNLGLIYLTQWKDRLDYETIRTLFPELIPGLVQHEGIGFILVNSKEYGALAIGKEGVYYLEKNIIDGENPLTNFGSNAAKHLLRTNSFEHTPDILVNSFYDKDKDEVAAFEELIGSHGGLGGTQNKPFIMYPNSWKVEDTDIVGAETIHKIIKENSKNL